MYVFLPLTNTYDVTKEIVEFFNDLRNKKSLEDLIKHRKTDL